MKKRTFSRIYELRKTFRCLIHFNSQKKKVTKDLSSCIAQKFTGFPAVRSETENKTRQLFSPVGIIFDPVKHKAIKINYYVSTEKHLAYRTTYKEVGTVKHSKDFECYCCSNYYIKKSNTKNMSKNALEYLVFFTILTRRILCVLRII